MNALLKALNTAILILDSEPFESGSTAILPITDIPESSTASILPKKMSKVRQEQRMPTLEELQQAGFYDLVQAIQHSGMGGK